MTTPTTTAPESPPTAPAQVVCPYCTRTVPVNVHGLVQVHVPAPDSTGMAPRCAGSNTYPAELPVLHDMDERTAALAARLGDLGYNVRVHGAGALCDGVTVSRGLLLRLAAHTDLTTW